jgi:uncharacterized phage protein (TIGR01671 family)
MKDRYLFRGKTISGDWVQGLLANTDDKWYISNKAGRPFAFEIRPESICQCTGLKDKNGNLIWENDIVSCKHEKYIGTDVLDSKMHKYTRNYAIEFENTFCNYGLRFRNKSIHFRCTQATLCMHDCEVLGNVFDNPELLEE